MLRWFFRVTEIALVGIVLLVALWLAGAVYYRYPGPLTQDKVVVITPGKGLTEIADQLIAEGVIRGPKAFFVFAVVLTDQHKLLKAGEYQFRAGERMARVVRRLASGEVVIHKVMVVEGSTVFAVLKQLREEPALTGPVPETLPEGSLYPDTYFFNRGDTRESVLKRMQTAFQQAVAEAWAGRSKNLPPQVQTPEAMVVLASLVEKETGVPTERERVAGVFINRLQRGMKLQSDPTTIYALTQGKGDLGRPLNLNDLQNTNSPYNTYVADGLPPGPICLPGRGALRAAAYPETHDFLYFVADGTGGHAFAKNLEDHNRNVIEWRRIQGRMREQMERERATGGQP